MISHRPIVALGSIALVLGASSCDNSKLTDVNKNPNAPEQVSASLLFPFLLFSHFKVRRFREDLGFADRRWRFPKAALCAGLVALMLLRDKAPLNLLFLYPMLALLTGSWLERKFLDRVKPW